MSFFTRNQGFFFNPRPLDFLYGAFCFLLGGSYILMAYTGYPQSESDSLWFLPAAVSYHKGFGLMNTLHEAAQHYDSSGQMRFLFYPPGFPLILSALMFEPTGRAAFVGIAGINFISLILSAILIYQILTRYNLGLSKRTFVLASLSLLSLSTYFGSFCLGRPDFLATLLVLLLAFVQLNLKNRLREFFSLVLLGLLGFIHPLAALFTASLLGIYYAWHKPWPTWVIPIVLIYGGGVAVFLLAMIVSPHGFNDSFEGILLHSKATLIHGTTAGFFKYWIMHSYATCYGLLFLSAGVATIFWYQRERIRIATRWAVLLFTLVIIVLIQHFVTQSWNRCYNLWLFSPFLIAILLSVFEDRSRLLGHSSYCLNWAIMTLLVFNAIGYLHTIALYGFYLKYGYKLSEARRDFAGLLQGDRDLIGVSKSLWILSEDYYHMRSFSLTPSILECNPKLIILQQRYTQYNTPPNLKGYELAQHNFIKRKPILFGIQLSPTMPGYFYAVYKKIK